MNRAYGFEGETKHKHGEQSYKVRIHSHVFLKAKLSLCQLFAHVFTACKSVVFVSLEHISIGLSKVPLATLVSATKPPRTESPKDILSQEGFKRYFVVHGGLFSKDGVTLEDVRKIERVGRQPGTEGLMCKYISFRSNTTLMRLLLGEVWTCFSTAI